MFSNRSLFALVAAATIVAGPLAASAQTVAFPAASAAPAHHHHGGSPYYRALRGLNLSPSQHTAIDGLMHNARTANAGVTDPASRKAARTKLRAQIDAVLTPEQRTQLQAADTKR